MSEEITRQLPDDILQTILNEVRAISAQLGETNARLSALEERVTKLEERVDRRLMETRPIWEAVLARLDKIEERLVSVESRLGGVETRLEGVETRLEEVESEAKDQRRSFNQIIKLFTRLTEDLREDVERRLDRLEGRDAA